MLIIVSEYSVTVCANTRKLCEYKHDQVKN